MRAAFVLASIASVLAGCDSDELAPVSNFEGSECLKTNSCGDDSIRLDSGIGGIPEDQSDGGGLFLPPPPGFDGGVGFDSGFGADAAEPSDAGVTEPGDAGVFGPPDTGVPPSVFLDLNGTWNTRYSFDLSAFLFGISGIADELDFIDQTFEGNIDTGFPPLDAFIVSIVQQYVPPWAVDLVNALNSMATLFSEVNVYGGRLTITQDAPLSPWDTTTALHASETWGELVMLIVEQCPRGRSDPNWPRCAEHRIPVTHNPAAVGPLEILVELDPFDGTLNAGIPQADFRFDNREVQLEARKLVLMVLDFVVSLTTPYANLRDALGGVVDCGGLGDQARDFAMNTLGLGLVPSLGIQALVEDQCNDLLDDLVNGVGGIGITWTAMEYDQLGRAIDTTSFDGLRRPEQLQQFTTPDTIDGDFTVGLSDDMGGRWEGLP
ncbi:hypothetical protein L6R52_15270 [Myxococcota bacterium]|nr:hypothetical protein [Myxococcota bacterium]